VKKFPSIAALGTSAPEKARHLLPFLYSEVHLEPDGFIAGAAFPRCARWADATIDVRRRDFLQFAGVPAAAGFASGRAARRTTAITAPTLPVPRAGGCDKPDPLAGQLGGASSVVGALDSNHGLQPRRDSGFDLKIEKFDEKKVIHDCGFGGAGGIVQ